MPSRNPSVHASSTIPSPGQGQAVLPPTVPERATLTTTEAARYVGLSVATFQSEVRAGTLPSSLALKARRRLWARATLDAALVRLHGGSATDAISEAIDAYEP